jgi:hypothetical protein
MPYESLDDVLKQSKRLIGAIKASHKIADTGGASVNAVTGDVAEKGESKVFVGGESDTSGNPIQAKFENEGTPYRRVAPISALQHMDRVRELTASDPDAHVGFWQDEKKPTDGIYVDASKDYETPEKARKVMRTRPDEISAWNMRTMREIKNPIRKQNK